MWYFFVSYLCGILRAYCVIYFASSDADFLRVIFFFSFLDSQECAFFDDDSEEVKAFLKDAVVITEEADGSLLDGTTGKNNEWSV